MNKLTNLLLEKEILLESGTNELEILVFDVGQYVFGVNVAKVREVLPAPAITHLPDAHPSIRGVFKLRNQVVPCVSLADYLGQYDGGEDRESVCILTDLNQQQTAFLVDRVERIHRLSWENVLAVPPLEDLSQTPVTALARCQDRLILMLDFEMILDQVTEHYFRTESVENPAALPREQALILLVEDSPTVREAITQTLSASGYSGLVVFENGKLAWEWLESKIGGKQPQDSPCDLVIADIEMPQVDGLHLTKRIKSHPQLKHIPVLLYSSIITPENRRKGEAVGADAQVAKPDLCHVVEYADNLIFGQRDIGGPQISDEKEAKDEESTSVVSIPTSVQQPETHANDDPSVSTELAHGPVSEGEPHVVGTTETDTHTERPFGEGDKSCSSDHDDECVVSTPVAVEHESVDNCSGQTEVVTSDSCESGVSDSDDDEAVVGLRPAVVENERLWNTFACELQHRWQALSELRRQISAKEGTFEPGKNFDLVVDVARILHTIKSAAMVVPVEIVTRTTHALESLIEAGSNRNEWPAQAFNRYCDWLEMFLNPIDQTWDSWVETGNHLAADLEQQLAHPTEMAQTAASSQG